MDSYFLDPSALDLDECARIHGLLDSSDSDDSESGKSEFDDEYYQNRLPFEIDYEGNTVLIKADPSNSVVDMNDEGDDESTVCNKISHIDHTLSKKQKTKRKSHLVNSLLTFADAIAKPESNRFWALEALSQEDEVLDNNETSNSLTDSENQVHKEESEVNEADLELEGDWQTVSHKKASKTGRTPEKYFIVRTKANKQQHKATNHSVLKQGSDVSQIKQADSKSRSSDKHEETVRLERSMQHLRINDKEIFEDTVVDKCKRTCKTQTQHNNMTLEMKEKTWEDLFAAILDRQCEEEIISIDINKGQYQGYSNSVNIADNVHVNGIDVNESEIISHKLINVPQSVKDDGEENKNINSKRKKKKKKIKSKSTQSNDDILPRVVTDNHSMSTSLSNTVMQNQNKLLLGLLAQQVEKGIIRMDTNKERTEGYPDLVINTSHRALNNTQSDENNDEQHENVQGKNKNKKLKCTQENDDMSLEVAADDPHMSTSLSNMIMQDQNTFEGAGDYKPKETVEENLRILELMKVNSVCNKKAKKAKKQQQSENYSQQTINNVKENQENKRVEKILTQSDYGSSMLSIEYYLSSVELETIIAEPISQEIQHSDVNSDEKDLHHLDRSKHNSVTSPSQASSTPDCQMTGAIPKAKNEGGRKAKSKKKNKKSLSKTTQDFLSSNSVTVQPNAVMDNDEVNKRVMIGEIADVLEPSTESNRKNNKSPSSQQSEQIALRPMNAQISNTIPSHCEVGSSEENTVIEGDYLWKRINSFLTEYYVQWKVPDATQHEAVISRRDETHKTVDGEVTHEDAAPENLSKKKRKLLQKKALEEGSSKADTNEALAKMAALPQVAFSTYCFFYEKFLDSWVKVAIRFQQDFGTLLEEDTIFPGDKCTHYFVIIHRKAKKYVPIYHAHKFSTDCLEMYTTSMDVIKKAVQLGLFDLTFDVADLNLERKELRYNYHGVIKTVSVRLVPLFTRHRLFIDREKLQMDVYVVHNDLRNVSIDALSLAILNKDLLSPVVLHTP